MSDLAFTTRIPLAVMIAMGIKQPVHPALPRGELPGQSLVSPPGSDAPSGQASLC